MLRKWNRVLAFLLSVALVTTTFGSDFATARVYAEEIERASEDFVQDENSLGDLSIAESVEETQEETEEVSEEPAEPVEETTEETNKESEEGAEPVTGETPEVPAETPEVPAETPEVPAVTPEVSDDAAAGETVAEEKFVTVTYKTDKGGTLSNKSEKVDINKE